MATAAIVGAGITAAGSIAGQAINSSATGKLNRKTMAFTEKMAARQHDDALADWNRQNDYNSPVAQMARLREGGLNPNLIYGQGAGSLTAQPIRGYSVGTPQLHAPQVNPDTVGQAVSKYYDIRTQQAQTDNLKAQNTNITEDTNLKKIQQIAEMAKANNTDMATAAQQFDLYMKQRLADTQVDAANLQNMKTYSEVAKNNADIQYTLDQNQRAAALNSQTVQEAAERILTIQAERTKIPAEKAEILARIANLKADTSIKQSDEELKKGGLQPHDPLWQRALKTALDKYMTPFSQKAGKVLGSVGTPNFSGFGF